MKDTKRKFHRRFQCCAVRSAHRSKSITQWKVLISGHSRRNECIRVYGFRAGAPWAPPYHGLVCRTVGRTMLKGLVVAAAVVVVFFSLFFLLPQNLFWNGKWIGKSNGRMYSAFNEHSLCTNEREFITVEMAERRRLHCSRWTFHSCRQWETHLRPAYSPLLRTKSSQTQTNIENGRSVRAQQAYFFGIACTCVMDGWRSEHKENP